MKLKMTLANKITLIRAGMSIIMFLLMIIENSWTMISASLLFAVAASTDWIDGRIARSTNTATPFGAIVDPFVDKVLVGAAFFAFTEVSYLSVPVWAVFIIILRELMVSTLRVLAALDNHVMAAERWGKFKTTVQLIALGLIFFIADVKLLLPLTGGCLKSVLVFLDNLLGALPYSITVITALVTALSGISYLKNNWSMLVKSWSLPVND